MKKFWCCGSKPTKREPHAIEPPLVLLQSPRPEPSFHKPSQPEQPEPAKQPEIVNPDSIMVLGGVEDDSPAPPNSRRSIDVMQGVPTLPNNLITLDKASSLFPDNPVKVIDTGSQAGIEVDTGVMIKTHLTLDGTTKPMHQQKMVVSAVAKTRREKKISQVKGIICDEVRFELVVAQKSMDLLKADKSTFMMVRTKVSSLLCSFLLLADALKFFEALKKPVKYSKAWGPAFTAIVNHCFCSRLHTMKMVGSQPITDRYLWVRHMLANDPVFMYWNLFIDLNIRYREYEELFLLYSSKNSSHLNTIKRDVDRTFTDNFKTDSQKKVLNDVLVAISNSETNGYVQGYNSMVGSMLIYFMDRLDGAHADNRTIVMSTLVFTLFRYMMARRSLDMVCEVEWYGYKFVKLSVRLWLQALYPELYRKLVRLP